MVLLSKSIDWFLDNRDLRHESVKELIPEMHLSFRYLHVFICNCLLHYISNKAVKNNSSIYFVFSHLMAGYKEKHSNCVSVFLSKICLSRACFLFRRILRLFAQWEQYRDRSRTAATSKMELFVIIVNGFQLITKCSILDAAAVLDPSLQQGREWRFVSIFVLQLPDRFNVSQSWLNPRPIRKRYSLPSGQDMKKHYHSYSNKFYKGIENIVNCKIIDYQV